MQHSNPGNVATHSVPCIAAEHGSGTTRSHPITARRANTPLQRLALCARLCAHLLDRAPARAFSCTWKPPVAAARVHSDLVTGLLACDTSPSDSSLATQALETLWGCCEGDMSVGASVWTSMVCRVASTTSLLVPPLALRPHTPMFISRARAPRVDARFM